MSVNDGTLILTSSVFGEYLYCVRGSLQRDRKVPVKEFLKQV